jgi:peptide/nickel transport system substrate-binding protein
MIRHLFIICCVGVLVACQSGTQIPQPIRFAVAQAPINLDPRYATDAASERANRLLYQRLVEFDASAKPIAGIASWHAESPLRYRFTLKEGLAPFHNGHVVSAADVKATYDSFAQLKDAPHAAEFANISRITVLNERTLFMDLKVPDAHFPAKLIIGILPQPLIEKHHDFAHHPVGSGVFQFSSWQDKLMLKRVADGQLVSLSEVKDPTVRVLKLLRGEADLLQGDLPPELVKYLQTKPEVSVQSVVGANFSYLGLNMQDPVLQQLKVRQALAYAIDRQAIINFSKHHFTARTLLKRGARERNFNILSLQSSACKTVVTRSGYFVAPQARL